MMETEAKKDLVLLALETFIGDDSPLFIERIGEKLLFQTVLGNSGKIEQNNKLDWDVFVNENLVYSIENQVFNILYNSENAPEINEYTIELKKVYSTQLQQKSKVFVGWIIEGILRMAMNQKIKIQEDIQFGPFLFLGNDNLGRKNIILN
jgi:hypothetical protein